MKTLFKGRFLTVQDRSGWEYADRPGKSEAVIIIAMDGTKMILVEQFRPPQNAFVISNPAGLVEEHSGDPAADREKTAHKELLEETGYIAERMHMLMSGPVSPGMTTEIIRIFLAENVRWQEEAKGDGDEELTLHLVEIDGIADWLGAQEKAGKQIDLKLTLALAAMGKYPFAPAPG